MRRSRRGVRVLAVALMAGVAAGASFQSTDPFLWLEELRSFDSITWVEQHNQSTLGRLQSHPEYLRIESEIRDILTAKDRIPGIRRIGDQVYNFWQDADHVQGILRRTTLADYESVSPSWETVIDLDVLSKHESKRWVYKGLECLPRPQENRCLLSLSDGGRDAVSVREFDLAVKDFVAGGFSIPESKATFTWVNENLLALGTNWGAGSLTDSGYPREIRLWARGTPLGSARSVYEGRTTDVSVSVSAVLAQSLVLLTRNIDFFQRETFVLDAAGAVTPWRLPTDAQMLGITRSWSFYMRRQGWNLGNGVVAPAGSLVALPWSSTRGPDLSQASIAWQPNSRTSLQGLAVTKDHVIVNVRDNVRSRAYRLRQDSSGASGWILDPIALPDTGLITLSSAWEESNEGILGYQDFLTPPSTFLVNFTTLSLRKLKTAPERFDSSKLVTEQHFAPSFDGTLVPYFLIFQKGMRLDGTHPTILTGYGGFMVPMTPYYLGATGKTWLERGGVYVIANIRGGGEFGPAWHEAARREKRQVAFDDFFTVAEDLIARGVTTPARLGIEGGSNGGLLVGAAFTQRPALFGAVVCAVPLLDMLRYHRLLAGASWISEYGNPDLPSDRAFLEKYSPYQNAAAGKGYPEVFFTGSTADDRVHPGHARKMAAKLESLGYPVLFYENTEGGHSGAANLEQRIRMLALQQVYFAKKLGL